MENRLDLAQSYFDRALRFSSDAAMPRLALGLLHKQGGHREFAKREYMGAAQANPFFGPAFFELGLAYLEEKNWPEAAKSFHRGIEIDGKSPDFQAAHGFALAMQNQAVPAVAAYNRAIELMPAGRKVPFEWHFQRGVLFGLLDRYPEAKADFFAAFKAASKLPSETGNSVTAALSGEYESIWKKPELKKSRPKIEEEIQIDVAKAQARIAASRLLWQAGQLKEAVAQQDIIGSALAAQVSQLRSERKRLSLPAKLFIRNLWSDLPTEMQNHPEVKILWRELL